MSQTAYAPSATDGISLVPRLGERREQELCVMSFVALLAGERHTDRPSTACPVITAFVIKINDAIDCDTRQALKPLAHDILGTNDGHSRERAWFLARTCINDVFARLVSETGVAAKLPTLPVSRDDSIDFKALSSELNAIGKRSGVDSSLLFDIRYLLRALARGSDELVAIASAVLFVDTAHRNGAPPGENPFWQAAIAMFSHLCGIGKVTRGPVAMIEEQIITEAIRTRTGNSYAPLFVWMLPERWKARISAS